MPATPQPLHLKVLGLLAGHVPDPRWVPHPIHILPPMPAQACCRWTPRSPTPRRCSTASCEWPSCLPSPFGQAEPPRPASGETAWQGTHCTPHLPCRRMGTQGEIQFGPRLQVGVAGVPRSNAPHSTAAWHVPANSYLCAWRQLSPVQQLPFIEPAHPPPPEQAVMVRKMGEGDVATQWTINYNLSSRLRMTVRRGSAKGCSACYQGAGALLALFSATLLPPARLACQYASMPVCEGCAAQLQAHLFPPPSPPALQFSITSAPPYPKTLMFQYSSEGST